MVRAESKAKGHGSKEPFNVLYDAFGLACGQVLSFTTRNSEDFVELRVKQRGEGDFLAIAKRIGPDGGDEVCFGVGFDFLSCLLGLNGAITANRWRPDQPWGGGGNGKGG